VSTAARLAFITVTLAEPLTVASAELVAVTVYAPTAEGAVYKPLELMTPVVLLPPATPSTDHVTAVLVDPCTVAVNCCVPDGGMTAEDGDTFTLMPLTVSVAVPLTPLIEAVIVVEPSDTDVARPLDATVATAVVPDVQVTVVLTLPVEPSLYVAVAVNCCVPPAEMLGLAGETAMDVTVLVTAATLSVAVPLIPLSEAVIVAEPEATALAIPLESIVATAVVADVQVALELMSAVELSLYFAVAVNCCVVPTPVLAVEGVTDTDVSVFPGGPPLELAGIP
jgi:hypothetical protein